MDVLTQLQWQSHKILLCVLPDFGVLFIPLLTKEHALMFQSSDCLVHMLGIGRSLLLSFS